MIGGGPAGALAAALSARSGLDTLLLERSAFPRDKVCGGILGGLALAALETANASAVLARCGSLPVREFEVVANGRSVRLPLPRHRVVARRDFDAALLDLASRDGAEVWTETRGAIVEDTADRAIVAARSATAEVAIEARVVIAADGLGSRALGESTVASGSRIGAGAVIASDDGPPPHVLSMAIGAHGYVGMVRLPNGDLDVAAAIDPEFARGRSLGAACDAILEESGVGGPSLRARLVRGTPALTRRPPRAGRGRVFAVGDAAGYVEPFTGEGIGWALVSALTLAPLLPRAASGDRSVATEYGDRLGIAVRDRQRLCRALAWTMRRPPLVDLALLAVRAAPFLAAGVISRLDRAPGLVGATR